MWGQIHLSTIQAFGLNTLHTLFLCGTTVSGRNLAWTTDSTGACLASAELYNQSIGTFTTTGSIKTTREFFTATLLNNGQVLIAAGAARLSSAELYNPSTGTFSVTGSLNTGRREHTAVLLTDGEVLAAGGYDGNGGNIGYLSSAELFH
jgi:hypothetical protein